ncbi:MAG: SDR family oxidoreductase [Kineosporiaceae bacterium]
MPSMLITGAGTGIGLATALHAARNGYRVQAGYLLPEHRKTLLTAAEAENLPLRPVELDVTDQADVDRVVATAEEGGGVDVLVNNAGVGRLGPVEAIDDDTLRLVLEVNLLGALRMTRAVLPGMRSRRAGSIVVMSSVNGRIVLPAGGPYFISKHALEAASEMLAVEVRGYGIRVAIVEPGSFATDILREGLETVTPASGSPYEVVQRRSAAMVAQGMRHAGDPAEVARAVLAAVESPRPVLRHVVGRDAAMLLAARSRVTDEQWVEFGGLSSDEEYVAAMTDLMTRG